MSGSTNGSSGFGQKAAFGGFRSTPTQTNPFGSATQPSQPAFESSIFGSSTTPFGASSQPAFGSTEAPAFGATSTPAFGSSGFGQKAASGGFGSTPTQTNPFGSATQPSQPAFESSIFDATNPLKLTGRLEARLFTNGDKGSGRIFACSLADITSFGPLLLEKFKPGPPIEDYRDFRSYIIGYNEDFHDERTSCLHIK